LGVRVSYAERLDESRRALTCREGRTACSWWDRRPGQIPLRRC